MQNFVSWKEISQGNMLWSASLSGPSNTFLFYPLPPNGLICVNSKIHEFVLIWMGSIAINSSQLYMEIELSHINGSILIYRYNVVALPYTYPGISLVMFSFSAREPSHDLSVLGYMQLSSMKIITFSIALKLFWISWRWWPIMKAFLPTSGLIASNKLLPSERSSPGNNMW